MGEDWIEKFVPEPYTNATKTQPKLRLEKEPKAGNIRTKFMGFQLQTSKLHSTKLKSVTTWKPQNWI